jgi:hypothetical protein
MLRCGIDCGRQGVEPLRVGLGVTTGTKRRPLILYSRFQERQEPLSEKLCRFVLSGVLRI